MVNIQLALVSRLEASGLLPYCREPFTTLFLTFYWNKQESYSITRRTELHNNPTVSSVGLFKYHSGLTRQPMLYKKTMSIFLQCGRCNIPEHRGTCEFWRRNESLFSRGMKGVWLEVLYTVETQMSGSRMGPRGRVVPGAQLFFCVRSNQARAPLLQNKMG